MTPQGSLSKSLTGLPGVIWSGIITAYNLIVKFVDIITTVKQKFKLC
jgi:hypothetical protein